jgi:hypothetical protein
MPFGGRIAKRQLVAGVGALLWAWLLYSGIGIYLGAAAQGVAGLPSREHRALYIWTPAIMAVIALVLVVAAKRMPLWLFLVVLVVLMAAILPVAMLFGGGV